MRGNELTDAQLAAADQFLTKIEKTHAPVVIIKRENIVRLLAWYAAVRMEGLKQGGGDDGEIV